MGRNKVQPDTCGVLEKCAIFKDLSPMVIQEALAAGQILEFGKGSEVSLFAGSLYVVLSGTLTVSSNNIVLNILEKGSITGVSGLFSDGGCAGGTARKTAVCASRPAKVFALSESALRDLMGKSPELAENYIRFLTGRIRFLNSKMSLYTTENAEKRLAAYILELSGEECLPVTVNLSKLAAYLNMGRATLYRNLDYLAETGAIEKEGNKITVLSAAKLRKISQHGG